MTVSVCMAVYNGASYLRTQITSILDQLSTGDELVIVDDRSTDSTRELLREFNDPRMRVITMACNRGPLRAFEAALMAARGKIIFFADQDDVWLPGKVERTVELFMSTDALAVVTDAMVVGPGGEGLVDSYFAWRKSGPGLLKNFYKNTFVGCCMAVRQECKEFALPLSRLALMHDVWIGLCCEIAGKTVFLPERLVMYRRHGGTYTRMARYAWPKVVCRRVVLSLGIALRLPKILAWRVRQRRKPTVYWPASIAIRTRLRATRRQWRTSSNEQEYATETLCRADRESIRQIIRSKWK